VPAAVVMVGVHHVAYAAGHVDAEHQGVDEFAARRTAALGHCQQGGCHRACGVDDGFEVGVVKVKGVRVDAVDQGGAAHIELFATAQHGGLGGRVERLRGLDGGDACLMVGRAYRAA
jgi:hypothetical protein